MNNVYRIITVIIKMILKRSDCDFPDRVNLGWPKPKLKTTLLIARSILPQADQNLKSTVCLDER